MKINAFFAQGARCGHLEGKARVGVYVADEEELLAGDAANAQNLRYTADRYHWANGYAFGYRIGASGESLPSAVESAPLPEEPYARRWQAEV